MILKQNLGAASAVEKLHNSKELTGKELIRILRRQLFYVCLHWFQTQLVEKSSLHAVAYAHCCLYANHLFLVIMITISVVDTKGGSGFEYHKFR